MKNVIKSLVKYLMMTAVVMMLGFGGISMVSGQAVAMAAESPQTARETAEVSSTATEDDESAVLFVVLGGGLIIILAVVISVVSSVVSSVASAVDDEE